MLACHCRDWTGVDFVEILEKPDADLTSVDPLPPSDVFLEFLRHRALDESVFVRKSALQVRLTSCVLQLPDECWAQRSSVLDGPNSFMPSRTNFRFLSLTPQVLENILKFGRVHPSEELVSVLRDHCRDSSLMVRKQMVCSLTDLVKKFPEDNIVIRLWVDGVFPLFLDVEQRVAEKVHEVRRVLESQECSLSEFDSPDMQPSRNALISSAFGSVFLRTWCGSASPSRALTFCLGKSCVKQRV